MCHAALVAARSLLEAALLTAVQPAAMIERRKQNRRLEAAECSASIMLASVLLRSSRRLRAATSAAWHIAAEGAASTRTPTVPQAARPFASGQLPFAMFVTLQGVRRLHGDAVGVTSQVFESNACAAVGVVDTDMHIITCTL